MLWLWRIGRDVSDWVSSTLTRQDDTSPRRNRRLAREISTPFRPISKLGPHYLELCSVLCKIHRDEAELVKAITSNREEESKNQHWFDVAVCDEERMERDQRADFTEELAHVRDIQETAGATAAEKRDTLATNIATKSRLDNKMRETWHAFWKHFQEYINRCLEVSFTEHWCLNHGQCVALRTSLDTYNMLTKRRQQLRELKIERVWTRHQPNGPDLEDAIRRLDNLIELANETQNRHHAEFASDFFEPFLRSAGKLDDQSVPAGPGKRSQDSDHPAQLSLSLPRASDSQSDAQMLGPQTQPSERNAQHPLDESVDRAQLHQDYEQALNRLLKLQNDLHDHEEQWRPVELAHLAAFPKSSKMRFSQLVLFMSKGIRNQLLVAEEDLQLVVDSLNKHGFPIPQTRLLSSPRQSHSASAGDYVRISGSFNSPIRSGKLTYSERLRMARIDQWRTVSRPDGFTLSPATPPAAQTEVTNGEDGPSPPPSTPKTPSSGQKRKLRQYSEMQGELRDKAGKIAKTATTVEGGSSSSRRGGRRES